jgi:hypothetical protein
MKEIVVAYKEQKLQFLEKIEKGECHGQADYVKK